MTLLTDKNADWYRQYLLKDIVPFWMKHTVDLAYGGISNVVDDDGHPINHDKYLWSQGRALWTFAALYNRIDKKPEWLEFANHIFHYLSNHGRDEQGRWMYRLDKDHQVLDRDISIYVDGFVMMGLAEYYEATGDGKALQLALETYENVIARLRIPDGYGTAPYSIPPGMKVLGIRMLFSYAFFNLGKTAARPDICAEGVALAHEILDDFYIPGKGAVLEYVSLKGDFVDNPWGRICIPGHVIEALWFAISIFEQTGDAERINTCCHLIKRHLDLAWDNEQDGLKLALDIDGKEPCIWNQAECKAWWVHCEALVATAYAHRHTGEDWCLTWHNRVHDYAWSHYPVPGGEWRQWLDRQGLPMSSAALPVKDPFHLPRALIMLANL
ncbi:MAG: AGE family epimerase/isomerase [Verrucomicrobia bacterium]|nr:AGE family epimerase/isomerase [Verrucomicrobiota bacterium]